jgi:serine/threonine protein phosphatase 1
MGRPTGDRAISAARSVPQRRLRPGERIYAVGDIHGRLDLFGDLAARIRADNDQRGAARTTVILLGDLIDRGPGSAELVQRAMRYTRASDRFVVLKGNHEQTMVDALKGDFQALAFWLQIGGASTLTSWGVPADLIRHGAPPQLMKEARRRIGPEAIAWLETLPAWREIDGYLFVHAGIRPGAPLARQRLEDLLWIGDDFLRQEIDLPLTVVHGHRAGGDAPDLQSDKIGIDTGAYRTGRLTALGLEGEARWTLTT